MKYSCGVGNGSIRQAANEAIARHNGQPGLLAASGVSDALVRSYFPETWILSGVSSE